MSSSHFYVPTCQWTCQRAKRRANVLTCHATVPNGVPIFQLSVPTSQKVCQLYKQSAYEMLRQISLLCYYIKNSTFYLISESYLSYQHVSHMWIVIVLHLYTSCHIKENFVEWKYKKTWFLYVWRVFSNFSQLKQLSKIKHTWEYCDLHELRSAQVGDPR